MQMRRLGQQMRARPALRELVRMLARDLRPAPVPRGPIEFVVARHAHHLLGRSVWDVVPVRSRVRCPILRNACLPAVGFG